MRPYEIGNQDIDRLIADLVETSGDGANADLIRELIVTALKLQRDQAGRGELKLFNTALKEMRYSNLIFSRYAEIMKLTIFGSARTKPDDPNYRLAHDFARAMVERDWMVITGAGPGIMEAGNKGAGPDASFGVNIRLPFEASANDHVPDSRVINFKYFFTRKLGFVKESHAFAVLPGGFGTMDEAFELLTLVQTGKTDIHPIVFMEAEGGDYWANWRAYVEETLVDHGMISAADLNLFTVTSDIAEAADEICDFYANYHSQRYVDGRLVLRVLKAPSPEELAALNEEFADIVVEGVIEQIEATPREVADADALDCARITFTFDRRNFGRLRQLIDRLNQIEHAPSLHADHIPVAFRPDTWESEPD